jgi:ABC-type dipeptide/oligopeptide/nickel transport system permease component
MVPAPDRPRTGTLTAVARRGLAAAATLWAAATVAFFALRLTGGDPTESLLAQGLATPQQVAQLRAELGFDRPLLHQYWRFVTSTLQGDFGRSLYTGRPVAEIVAEQLPFTLELALAAMAVSVVIGMGLGIAAGWRPESWAGRLADSISAIATGVPVAVAGILALLAAAGLGRVAPPLMALTSAGGILLPALVLGFVTSGALARVVQAGLDENRKAAFIVAARARGISAGWRLLRHALRPVLPLAVSLVSLQAAFLLSGTVVTESVFSRPGLGRLLVSAILESDYPIVQGLVVIAAAVYTASQAAADALGLLLDPRLAETNAP